jgi:hypothetical protein
MGSLLRRGGSNSRPLGYEPNELPLLYFAIWLQRYLDTGDLPNNTLIYRMIDFPNITKISAPQSGEITKPHIETLRS